MKRWECTVCGYIHEGDEPPDKCPVCGAGKEKFIEITIESEYKKNKKTASKNTGANESKKIFQQINNLMIKHHIHPISAHLPNGVLPVAVIFIALGVWLNSSQLFQAAFYNLFVVFLAMPIVMCSGYNEWKKRYQGKLTRLFLTKIICAIIVLFTLTILVLWRAFGGYVSVTSHKWIYFFIHIVMLGAASGAGYIGGKLVFKD